MHVLRTPVFALAFTLAFSILSGGVASKSTTSSTKQAPKAECFARGEYCGVTTSVAATWTRRVPSRLGEVDLSRVKSSHKCDSTRLQSRHKSTSSHFSNVRSVSKRQLAAAFMIPYHRARGSNCPQGCLRELDTLDDDPMETKAKPSPPPHRIPDLEFVPGVKEPRQRNLLDLQLRRRHILHSAPCTSKCQNWYTEDRLVVSHYSKDVQKTLGGIIPGNSSALQASAAIRTPTLGLLPKLFASCCTTYWFGAYGIGSNIPGHHSEMKFKFEACLQSNCWRKGVKQLQAMMTWDPFPDSPRYKHCGKQESGYDSKLTCCQCSLSIHPARGDA
ncbi:hypothetical protein FB451DRAFT_1365920 [Mycena latifolia]|nr:hypothetical protein FB451DRAFT_1365920 [Mycena latifolia]